MRPLIVAVTLCVVGCAGTPQQKAVVPERIKGPYKVVMKGDKKLFCTKELATGSHVNYRTICLTPEEYAKVEQESRDWHQEMLKTSGLQGAGGLPPVTQPGAQ